MNLVLCTICRDAGNPHRWRELCGDCAETTADKHRTETGHHVELTITSEHVLPADSRTMRMLGRRGW